MHNLQSTLIINLFLPSTLQDYVQDMLKTDVILSL